MLIGIDLDNTLICYDQVFRRLAAEAGLQFAHPSPGPKEIRAAARRCPEGDIAWQKLQGAAYGPGILEARPAEGVLDFLRRCARERVPVWVISHKTEFAAQDPTRTNLRRAALDWLAAQGLFRPEMGLEPGRCRFAASRTEKIALIRSQGCTHFVDDLDETFREPSFPDGVTRILYAPQDPVPVDLPGVRIVRSWAEVPGVCFP
ncbi:MAG: hypothetical protein ABSH53_10590 [Holophaga sp.]|jgi:hypothetical protein